MDCVSHTPVVLLGEGHSLLLALFCVAEGCASHYIICYSALHQALVTCQKFLKAS